MRDFLGHYDRQGRPMTTEEWARTIESGIEAKRVAVTTLPNGKWVSTVWLGTDHRFGGDGPPLIFETMVFPAEGEWSELDTRRYSTEEEAIAGHQAMVEKWSRKEVSESD